MSFWKLVDYEGQFFSLVKQLSLISRLLFIFAGLGKGPFQFISHFYHRNSFWNHFTNPTNLGNSAFLYLFLCILFICHMLVLYGLQPWTLWSGQTQTLCLLQLTYNKHQCWLFHCGCVLQQRLISVKTPLRVSFTFLNYMCCATAQTTKQHLICDVSSGVKIDSILYSCSNMYFLD